jgi:hypothetical protein
MCMCRMNPSLNATSYYLMICRLMTTRRQANGRGMLNSTPFGEIHGRTFLRGVACSREQRDIWVLKVESLLEVFLSFARIPPLIALDFYSHRSALVYIVSRHKQDHGAWRMVREKRLVLSRPGARGDNLISSPSKTLTHFFFSLLPQRLLSLSAADYSCLTILHCISLYLGRSHQL